MESDDSNAKSIKMEKFINGIKIEPKAKCPDCENDDPSLIELIAIINGINKYFCNVCSHMWIVQ